MENSKNSTTKTPYDENPELVCLLCFDILRDPKTCSECLEANFCSRCAEEALIKNPECPNCHSKWSDKSVKTNPAFLKNYKSTVIKCQNKECGWEGLVPTFFEHKEVCEKKPLFCNLAKYGCEWSGLQGDEKKHSEVCIFKPFKQHFDRIEHKLEDSQNELEVTRKKLEESEKNIEVWKNKCSQSELGINELREEIIRVKESEKSLLSKFEDYLIDFKTFRNQSSDKLKTLWEVHSERIEFNSNIEKLKSPFFDTTPNKNFLRKVIPESFRNLKMNLLFRASRDGFKASDFHRLCDNKGPTLTFIKAKNGYYFGGYSSVDWDSSPAGCDKKASGSFLFSFNHQTIMNIYQNEGQGIHFNKNYGPIFGGGRDLLICDSCNGNNNSHSNLGYTYKCDFTHGSAEAQNYLAGSYNFTVEDYEVYSFC